MASSKGMTAFDYIIVGGGTAGCVVAARLHEALPDVSIALLEAGPDYRTNPLIQDPRAAQALHETDLQWKYMSAPQASLNGRTLPNWGGKVLSGSSAVNYTAWTRGHASDYDRWAKIVGNGRWSFESLLPAFKRSECWHDRHSPLTELYHGFDGPIRTQSGDVGFPLREPTREAFQFVGMKLNPDINSGTPNGIAPLVLNWSKLQRQHAAACYPLNGVQIFCNTLVAKVLIDGDGRATGVQVAGSLQHILAKKEVIISCGAIRTPQLLMLSGIGLRSELERLEIPHKVDSPYVGKNFLDHYAVTTFWKLKNPDQGLALGNPNFNNPSFDNSLPMDWMITGEAPSYDLKKASDIDGSNLELGPRSDFELTPMYLTNGAVPDPWLPFDGSYLSCGVMCLSTTSQGRITLKSVDPYENPVIDPCALSTEHDRTVLRAGMRTVINAMSSPALQPFLTGQAIPPPGLAPLTQSSTDQELDEHIRALVYPWFHAAGTAAMGQVVDSECRVKGVSGLRVVDASIIPISITAHLQAPVYAIAEQAASMIAESAKSDILRA